MLLSRVVSLSRLGKMVITRVGTGPAVITDPDDPKNTTPSQLALEIAEKIGPKP